MSLNILEVCFSEALGGLELYMVNISRALRERGHGVFTVAPPDSPISKRLDSEYHFRLTSRWRYLDIPTALRLNRILRQQKIHILHAHRSSDLSTLVLAKLLAGRGRIVFTQQMESSRVKKDLFHRWVFAHVDALIAITNRIVYQARENLPLSPDKIHLLYYGIDLKRFQPNTILRQTWREHLGIRPDEVVIGIVGRLEPGKGQHIFLEAAAQVSQKLPNLRFVIIGGETIGQSGYEAQLKAMAKQLQIEDRVVFTGFVDNVWELANILDIVVLATKKETFGLSLVEAMALGVVPIGTNAGGVPEIIEHNRNGLLVEPMNPVALARAMFKLAGDSAKRQRLSRAARRTVREKFNLEHHLEGLEKIFYSVMNL